MRNLHTHNNTINTKYILQAIKGWYSATTYIVPKKIKKHTQKINIKK